MNARSMSGLNDNVTSSGDVFLNGNPNAFTGTNTFNINRPTSTIATTPGSTDFITKQNADALYGGAGNVFLNGNPNAFTGTNTFNSNRPTSTITTAPGSTDFITKQNADALYTNNTGDAILNGDNAFSGTNTFNSNRPTSTITTAPGSTDFITKQNADALYTNNTGDAILNGNNAFTGTTNTFANRPAASSTPDTLAGTLDFVIKRDTDLLYVTKDTDQDITGKKTFEDNVTLDGASNINIGQIELKGSVGNTIHQFTGSFGNQILQGTNTASAPSMPLGASLIYQAGTNDIIETEGKVVCPTAPTSGNDLTNKTYVDTEIAAAGGGGGPFAFTRTAAVDDITMASETNTPLTDLVVNITPTSTAQKVILHLTLLGDFDGDSWEPTIRIKRTIGGVDTYLTPTTAGSRNPMNSTFSVAVGLNDYSGTIKQANMVLVDTNPNTTSQITYTPVLFGFSANTFYQNRTKNDTNNIQHERSFSTFTAECKA